MSENSNEHGDKDYLVSNCFNYGDREFEVIVAHDGYSYWFDPIAKNAALKTNRRLIIMAAIDHQSKERKELERIHDEFTVKVLLPETDFVEIRDELSPQYWQDDIPDSCGERCDAILEPIFWEHVNPYLSPPVDEKFRPT